MKIYTKTGDSGTTALYGGTRVSKASARVESYGTIDELNSFIGSAKCEITDETVLNQLKKIQFDLFTVGSESSTPTDKLTLANGKSRLALLISEVEIEELENWMDELKKNCNLFNILYFQVAEKVQQRFISVEQFAEERKEVWFF